MLYYTTLYYTILYYTVLYYILLEFHLSNMMHSVNCGVSPGITTRILKYTTGCSSSKNYLLYFVVFLEVDNLSLQARGNVQNF